MGKNFKESLFDFLCNKNVVRGIGSVGLLGLCIAGLIAINEIVIEPNMIEGTNLYVASKSKDVYVVVERDGERELHKGDIEFLKEAAIKRGGGDYSDLTRKIFYCGEETISNEKYYMYQIRPNENSYDHECEDCCENN